MRGTEKANKDRGGTSNKLARLTVRVIHGVLPLHFAKYDITRFDSREILRFTFLLARCTIKCLTTRRMKELTGDDLHRAA